MVASFLMRAGSLGGVPLLDGSEADGTNLWTSPNDWLASPPWYFTEGGTFTNNAAVAPDGTTTAALFVVDSSTTRHANISYGNQFSYTADIPITVSYYVKKRELRYSYFATDSGGSDKVLIIFDIDTLSVTDTETTGAATITASSVEQGANGFVKCSATFKLNASATNTNFMFVGAVNVASGSFSANPPTFAGDGTSGQWYWRFKVAQ